MGHLKHQARAVAGLRVGALRTAVAEVDQDLNALPDDLVGLGPVYVGDEADAAGRVFEPRIVQALLCGDWEVWESIATRQWQSPHRRHRSSAHIIDPWKRDVLPCGRQFERGDTYIVNFVSEIAQNEAQRIAYPRAMHT